MTTGKLDGDTQDGIIGSSSAGGVAFLLVERENGGMCVPELLSNESTVIELNDSPIMLEADPNGSLCIGSTGRDDLRSLYQSGPALSRGHRRSTRCGFADRHTILRRVAETTTVCIPDTPTDTSSRGLGEVSQAGVLT